MTNSDLIAIAALLVSIASATYAHIAAREANRSNALAFRLEWKSACETMLSAHSRLHVPEGRFASLTSDFRRGYPLPLEDDLIRQLQSISADASLWSNLDVHTHLEDALRWNQELASHLNDDDPEDSLKTAKKQEEFKRLATNYAADTRRSLGLAIDLVRTRLRESAP
jgi:hypothetical protein